MRVRKNVLALTVPERNAFFRALLTLKTRIVNPSAPAADRLSVYDLYAAIHQAVFAIRTPVPGGETELVNGGHRGPAFGPWHRELLVRFELDLQSVDPTVMLPYWDWTDHAGTQTLIFSDDYFGPDGGPGGVGGGEVESGYFAYDAPSPLPSWWPTGLAGWRISPLLEEGEGTRLRRILGNNEVTTSNPFAGLPNRSDVTAMMRVPVYEDVLSGFRNAIEGDPFHNFIHRWMSGHMETGASPNDPLFFLHHVNIDRLWAMWQQDGHAGTGGYATGTFLRGHNLNDPMWPWVGAETGYAAPNLDPTVAAALPSFSGEPARRPVDLLDHRNIVIPIGGVPTQLGYSYDTEVVVGIALDRSSSMTGATPDPMTGSGSVSKWVAATRGVTHFLQDCEAAYSAAEAYVFAGVQTFNTVAGVPTYEPVFAGPTPYGIVKAMDPVSASEFTTAIGGLTPTGGTPLAGALVAAEEQLVRPVHGDRPSDDPRYIFILTDGKLTAGPALSTLAEPEFPDTTIFAMGFGIGSGWDGVDFATVQDLTEKGRAAPTGVPQVFHGESAGAIDKFFTQSIAATIGYVPVVDPIYELFPGESSMTRFHATSADQAFMITVVGFDYEDGNWSVMLHGPDGAMYHDAATSPCLVTMRRANGRTTMFIHRNAAKDVQWVGRWDVMVQYMPQAPDLGMVMFSPWQNLVPVGAPPVRGPLFSRIDVKPEKRATARLSVDASGHVAFPTASLATVPAGPPSSVAVEVYARTRLDVRVAVDPARFAGDRIDAHIELANVGGGRVSQLRAIGRLVAPAFSLGNLLSDAGAMPVEERNAFVDERTKAFDSTRFFAALERKQPGVLRIRDERLTFAAGPKSAFTATIADTRHPGVYWVAAQIDGLWHPPGGGKPQRFLRVVARQVPLGIRIEPEAARPVLHWRGPSRVEVKFFAGDKHGNIVDSMRSAPPVLRFRRQPLVAKHEVGEGGWHVLTTELEAHGPNEALCLCCGDGSHVPLTPQSGGHGFTVTIGGQSLAIPDTHTHGDAGGQPPTKPAPPPPPPEGGGGHHH